VSAGCSGRRSGWPDGGLAVAARVEGELAGGGVDDPDVQVLDWEQDAGSGMGPADAKGGHFAAFEQPAIFVDEVRAAFRSFRGG